MRTLISDKFNHNQRRRYN